MLYALLEGLAEDANARQLATLIRNATGILPTAARSKVQQLRQGEVVIVPVSADGLRMFLHSAERLGVKTAHMFVGPVDE
jgi:hypothetical protein